MDRAKKRQVSVNINLDTTPILYTDNIFMTTNQDGIVLDVCQSIAGTHQVRVVSRIGMSREHAKKVIDQMGKLLAMTEGQRRTSEKN